MVMPIAHAMRTAKANGVGPFAGDPNAQADGSHDQFGAPIRHQEGAVMHAAETVASNTGEGLFTKALALGAVGFGVRHTAGRVSKTFGVNFGRVTSACADAFDSISSVDLFREGGLKQLKANYYHLSGEYAKKHAHGPLTPWNQIKATFGGDYVKPQGAHVAKNEALAEQLLEKSRALGGAKLAKAEWKGIGKIGAYMAHRGAFSTVMAGGLALAGGLAMFRSGKHAYEGLGDLAEVVNDIDDVKYSHFDLLKHPEKLSPAAQEIRANLIAHLVPDAAGAVGHVIENGAFAAMGGPAAHAAGMMGGMGGMGIMMGGMMLGQSAEQFAPTLDFLHSYLAIKDMKLEGKAPPAELYAQLIAAASPEVRRVGGVESAQVQRIAQQYAEEGIAPNALVKEVFAEAPFKARAVAIAEAMAEEAEQEQGEDEMEAPEMPEGVDVPKAANENHAIAANETAPPKLGALMEAKHVGKMQEMTKEAAR